MVKVTKSVTIGMDQEMWLQKTGINFSKFVQRKLYDEMNAIKRALAQQKGESGLDVKKRENARESD